MLYIRIVLPFRTVYTVSKVYKNKQINEGLSFLEYALLINAISAGISAGLILQIFNEDYDLIVTKTLERVYKNYYFIIRGECNDD